VFGKMQAAYQSDEFDDTSSHDAASSDYTDEEDVDYEEEEEEVEDRDRDHAELSEAETDKSPWEQLSPRTRRKAPVKYTEKKVNPTRSPIQVCTVIDVALKFCASPWALGYIISLCKRLSC
jgi:hypothetical protein